MLPYDQENIVALATPPGIGALAIVRISGPNLKDLYKHYSLDAEAIVDACAQVLITAN